MRDIFRQLQAHIDMIISYFQYLSTHAAAKKKVRGDVCAAGRMREDAYVLSRSPQLIPVGFRRPAVDILYAVFTRNFRGYQDLARPVDASFVLRQRRDAPADKLRRFGVAEIKRRVVFRRLDD
jgi:hypothetical protein